MASIGSQVDRSTSRVTWRLLVQNMGPEPLQFRATIDFLDISGNVLQQTSAAPFTVQPSTYGTATGTISMSPATADKLFRTTASVVRIPQ
jgi:hypothetical protein